MRLVEIMDLGSIRQILAVKQGDADNKDLPVSIPFAALKKQLSALGISSLDAFNQLKDKVDKQGDVIKTVDIGKKDDEGDITLNTQEPNADTQQPINKAQGPSVQQMAKRNAKKLQPDF